MQERKVEEDARNERTNNPENIQRVKSTHHNRFDVLASLDEMEEGNKDASMQHKDKNAEDENTGRNEKKTRDEKAGSSMIDKADNFEKVAENHAEDGDMESSEDDQVAEEVIGTIAKTSPSSLVKSIRQLQQHQQRPFVSKYTSQRVPVDKFNKKGKGVMEIGKTRGAKYVSALKGKNVNYG